MKKLRLFVVALLAVSALPACRGGSNSNPDASTDADTDIDTDVDTDADSDSDSGVDTEGCPDTDGCAETPFAAVADTCTYSIDWSEVPDSLPDPPYSIIEKACDHVTVVASAGDGEGRLLLYSPDCTGESPDDGVFAWRWAEIDAPCEDLYAFDLDECLELELCPAACERFWDGTWSVVTVWVACSHMM